MFKDLVKMIPNSNGTMISPEELDKWLSMLPSIMSGNLSRVLTQDMINDWANLT